MSIFHASSRVTLHHHDVSVMPWPIPDHSVQLCLSSPPYFALRVYEGVAPAVWGGDPDCRDLFTGNAHDFEDIFTVNQNAGGGLSPKQDSNRGSRQMGGPLPRKEPSERGYWSRLCRRCGAWQGTLGNEPIHDCLAWAVNEPPCSFCYVCHIRMIFQEIRRVLRPDGVVVWNIGDTYSGSGGAGGDYAKGGLKEGQPKYPGTRMRASARRDREPVPRDHSCPGLKPKDRIGIPYRTALALQADGWYWRSICPWISFNGMPESVQDRPTRGHEEFLLFSASREYYFDVDGWRRSYTEKSIQRANGDPRRFRHDEMNDPGSHRTSRHRLMEGGRNRRDSDWFFDSLDAQIEETNGRLAQLMKLRRTGGLMSENGDPLAILANTQGSTDEHYAAFNSALVKPWISAATREGDTVLDPFSGTGTSGLAALELGRKFVGIEASEKYCQIAKANLTRCESVGRLEL